VIAYVDASALVKRYLVEPGSRETIALIAEAEMSATSIVTRAVLATFDQQLWDAASKAGVRAWPEKRPG
jgi:predicted nucleic acid-binding protein